jgi:GT2 family glycosyltransferase
MISVLIVTYNNADTVEDCLRSLAKQTKKDFEVVLVDNASSDGTAALVESIAPSVAFPLKRFYMESNLGFAGGNQYAFRCSSGDFLALLNPDAFPEPNWLEEMVAAIISGPDIGACASRMLSSSTDVTDSAGDGFASWLKGFKRGEGEGADTYNEPGYVFGACAGAALYLRAMLDDVGFFDEDFFLFHEDTDLNFRARLAGWKAFYVPTAVVHHKVRHSIGNGSAVERYYTLRNTELVRIKNIPAVLFLRHFPVFLVYQILEFFFFVLRHRSPAIYARAKMDVIKMAPAMWRKRSSIQKSRRVSLKELESYFTPLFDKRSLLAKGRRMIFD